MVNYIWYTKCLLLTELLYLSDFQNYFIFGQVKTFISVRWLVCQKIIIFLSKVWDLIKWYRNLQPSNLYCKSRTSFSTTSIIRILWEKYFHFVRRRSDGDLPTDLPQKLLFLLNLRVARNKSFTFRLIKLQSNNGLNWQIQIFFKSAVPLLCIALVCLKHSKKLK